MSVCIRANYPAAIWPDAHRVCGVRMKPHTLGHALLLRRLRNPYAIDAERMPIRFGDTIQAAYICSRSWRRAAWGVSHWSSFLWIRFRSFLRWRTEDEDRAAMEAYLFAAWDVPTVFGRRRGAAERGTDPIQILIHRQRQLWGHSMDAALSVPLGIAVLDQIGCLEEQGSLRVAGERDAALYAKLEEITAKYATRT